MIDWLLETLVWTGLLIGLVLLLRRPVARWFGPRIAYCLWLLPVLRVVMPPLELPAWMAPMPEGAMLEATALTVESRMLASETIGTAVSEPAAWYSTLPWDQIALAVWLMGAAIFLVVRFSNYGSMRRSMLAEAREVGRTGKVRLIETSATQAPLAFGIIDKVIALPVGFLATHDRDERDLALEHELAHHRGGDLIANFAAQPLFAMHWFNPLGTLGWLAMRRDQEAACDARVMEQKDSAERATYAKVIASFAAGPNAALAAPMACPVLGEKSIIERLRSLNMNEVSSRRRLAGRGLVAAALVALPLTATISYAASDAPSTPPAPPPAPVAPIAPTAPVPPAPPAPLALQAASEVEAEEHEEFVVREIVKDDEGKKKKTVEQKVIIKDKDGKLSKEEREALRKQLRREFVEMDTEIEEAMNEVRVAMLELKDEEHGITKIKIKCKDGSEGVALQGPEGNTVHRLCTSEIMAHALTGLKEARKAIATDSHMDGEMRAEVLHALDERIANWNAKGG